MEMEYTRKLLEQRVNTLKFQLATLRANLEFAEQLLADVNRAIKAEAPSDPTFDR